MKEKLCESNEDDVIKALFVARADVILKKIQFQLKQRLLNLLIYVGLSRDSSLVAGNS